jgi:hypothetical protein
LSEQLLSKPEFYLDGEEPGALPFITCYPFGAVMAGTPHRFVIFVRRVEWNGRPGESHQRAACFSNKKNSVQ